MLEVCCAELQTQARGVDRLGISWKHDVALITKLVVAIMIPTTCTMCIIYDNEKYYIFFNYLG